MGSFRIFLVIFFIPWLCRSQQFDRSVICTGGGVVSNGGLTISSTIGENFGATLIGPDSKLTQGFQQNYVSKLSLKLFLEGYYDSTGQMRPAMYNQGVTGSTASMVDTVVVYLVDPISYSVKESASGILSTTGNLTATFSERILQGSYYVAIRHRNSIETWSAAPVLFNYVSSYDLSTTLSVAFGRNLKQVEPGIFALFTSDMNQDGYIDAFDFPIFQADNINFADGYLSTDLNGDGSVDTFDYPIFEDNNLRFVRAIKP